MTRPLPLLFLICVLSVVNFAEGDLKIAAFNIQTFGKAKLADKDAFKVIVEIVRLYDIILIQEIRDKDGVAIRELLDEVNKGDEDYGLSLSERLGRSSSKEQYAYLYRTEDISILDDYQYPESEDKFERPPFCVKVQAKSAGIKEFALIGIHTSPKAAFEEINALKNVHDSVKAKWKTDDIMIMGDFNAGCSYVSKKQLQELDLRTSEFHWLITDDADTTLGKMQCSYDRFVLSGNRFWEAVVPGSAGILRFDQKYDLTHDKALAVSDHYPIEFSLQPMPICAASSACSGAASVKAGSILVLVAEQMRSMLSMLEL